MKRATWLVLGLGALLLASTANADRYGNSGHEGDASRGDFRRAYPRVELGPRPEFLVNEMNDGPLKQQLMACLDDEPRRTDFSIGHRGAPLQFPEHTKESYIAAARMGAGIVECDVTFTKDKQLVCRHAQNDLHTTTNILATPLARRASNRSRPPCSARTAAWSRPRTPNAGRARSRWPNSGRCAARWTRSIPRRKRSRSTWPERRISVRISTPDRRAAPCSRITESIALFKALGVKMTPELKAPSVTMPFDGFTQEAYAQKLDRRIQGHAGRSAQRLPAVVQHRRRALLGQARAALRPASRLSRRRERTGRSAELRRARGVQSRRHQHLGAADVRAARARRRRQRSSRRSPRVTRRPPGSTSSRGRSSARASSPTATTASTIRRSMRPSTAKATSTRSSTRWPRTSAFSACSPTGPRR